MLKKFGHLHRDFYTRVLRGLPHFTSNPFLSAYGGRVFRNVEESEEKWKISLLAKDVISLTGSIEDNLTDILNQTAFDAIDTEFNNGIAQLEGSVSDIDWDE